MALADILHPDGIIPALRVQSKKQLLMELATAASKLTGIPEREIFDVVLQREKLGSTSVGGGIAIPHGKLKRLDKITGVFARLETPVDFEALDDQPVDIVFMLLSPTDSGAEHLKTLARVSRLLRNEGQLARIRGVRSEAALFALLAGGEARDAA